MDAQTLAQAMGNTPGVNYTAMLPHIENAMRAANCISPLRAAHFLAQAGHESAGLRYMEEIADGSAYEGRADLGNTRPGDGRRFKGRGPIQLTGRANYRAFTRWAQNAGHTSHDFEANPHLLSQPKWGFLAASYYWTVARPNLNAQADRDDLEAVTRSINGGLNGLADRRQRLNRCKQLGTRILPTPRKEQPVVEKTLPYSRQWVAQNTPYYCGPASVQTIVLSKTQKLVPEATLAAELRTTTNGTDWIGQFPAVLNRYIKGANYRHVEMPNDPPNTAQKNTLWANLVNSIDGGHGVVANIVAPPSNYPRPSYKSGTKLAYRGGTVYHFFGILGYATDSRGVKHVWIADSGFPPYGSWITFDQLASLIPPKGYAYATAKPPAKPNPTQPPVKKEDAEVVPMSDSKKLDTIISQLSRIEEHAANASKRSALVLDQLAGPEKDAKGWKYTGWQDLGGQPVVHQVYETLQATEKIIDILNKEAK